MMKRLGLSLILVLAACAAFAQEPAYDVEIVGAGTATLLQPRAVRVGPSGDIYLIEGESDWATARSIAPDGIRSKRFSADVQVEGEPRRWFHPAGWHPTTSGDLLVADTGNRRILRLTADGKFKGVVVRAGGADALQGPTDALELPSGDVVVCDSASSRVLLYDASGKFKRVIAPGGTGRGEVNHPFSLALDREGDLWIADTLNRRLVELGADFRVKSIVAPSGPDGPVMKWISYLDVDREGNVLAADDGNSCVLKFSPKGELVKRIGMTDGEPRPFARVTGVAALADGTIVVSDGLRNGLFRFDARGKLLGEIGVPQYRDRRGGLIAAGVAPDGSFYLVAGKPTSSVRCYGADGLLKAEFGGEGTEPGKFLRPRAAAVGPDGNICVADSELHNVTIYRGDGVLVRAFGKAGGGASDMRYPRAIAVGADGMVYVGDAGNQRVQLYKPTGEFVRTFAGGLNPYLIDVDASGNCAVFDDARDAVVILDRAGKELRRVEVRGVSIAGMILEPDGRLLVLESRGGRIRSFGADGSDADVLKDPRLRWGTRLVRGPAGKPFVAFSYGLCALEGGALGALVSARRATEPGKLMRPYSLAAVWGDELAVLCEATRSIQVFGRDGKFRRVLETNPPVRDGDRVAAGPDGDLYVLASFEGKLWRVKRDGSAEAVLSGGMVQGAGGFAALPDGRFLLQQDARNGLVLVDASGKELGGVFSAPRGRGRYRGGGMRRFSVTPAGDLLVAEGYEGGVSCYGPDLKLKWTLDPKTLDEKVRIEGGPSAVGADAQGNLYLLGRDSAGIRKFGPDRSFLEAIRTDGSVGGLMNPEDLCLDDRGNLYVADTGNNRVVKFTRREVTGNR